jgi:hypothetical protein
MTEEIPPTQQEGYHHYPLPHILYDPVFANFMIPSPGTMLVYLKAFIELDLRLNDLWLTSKVLWHHFEAISVWDAFTAKAYLGRFDLY